MYSAKCLIINTFSDCTPADGRRLFDDHFFTGASVWQTDGRNAARIIDGRRQN